MRIEAEQQFGSSISIAMVATTDMIPGSSSLQLVHQPFKSCDLTQFLPPVLCFSFRANYRASPLLRALRTGSEGGTAESREASGSEVIRKPIVKELGGASDEDEGIEAKRDLSEAEEEVEVEDEAGEEDEGVDWEDKLLEETMPLVGFVRMILHSGR